MQIRSTSPIVPENPIFLPSPRCKLEGNRVINFRGERESSRAREIRVLSMENKRQRNPPERKEYVLSFGVVTSGASKPNILNFAVKSRGIVVSSARVQGWDIYTIARGTCPYFRRSDPYYFKFFCKSVKQFFSVNNARKCVQLGR